MQSSNQLCSKLFSDKDADLGIETAELPVDGFLESNKLLDIDVVSNQQSSESRFQFHPVVFILIRVFP